MRKLASFDDPAAAQALDRLLSSAEIPTVMRPNGDGQRTIWIVSEQDLAKAKRLFEAFLSDPKRADDPVPELAPGLEVAAVGPAEASAAEAQTQPLPRVVLVRKSWRERAAETPVTTSLLVASIVLAIYTNLGGNQPHVEQFTISRLPEPTATSWDPFGDLRAGQLWRLFTPILLHFHPFHLLFNVFWLNDLGGPSERFQGSWRFAGFILWSALLSNLAQLVFGHSPNFGGLSGIIYALVAYLWARGRADPSCGIRIPGSLVTFFVVWLVLGFSGVLNGVLGTGAIANYCHLGGFAAGALYGYIAAVIARQARSRA